MDLTRGPGNDASWEGSCDAVGSFELQGWIQPTAGVVPAMPALSNMLWKNSRTNLSHSKIKQLAKFCPFSSPNGNIPSRLMQKAREFPAKTLLSFSFDQRCQL